MDFALHRMQDISNLRNWIGALHTPPPESKTTVWVTDYFTEVIHPTYTEIEGPGSSSWDIPPFPTSTPDLDPFTPPWSSGVAAGQTTLVTDSSTSSQLPRSHTSASEPEQPAVTSPSNTIESSTTSTSSEESKSTTTSKTPNAFDTSTTSATTSTSDSTTTSETSRTSDTTTTFDTSITPSTTESSQPTHLSMPPLVTRATAPPLPSQSAPAGVLPAAAEYGSTTGEDVSGHAGVIAGSIIGGIAFIALTLLACFYCFRRKRQRPQRPNRPRNMREASFGSWNASSQMGSIRVLKYRQFSQPDCVDADTPPGLGPHAQKYADNQTTGGRPVPYRQKSGIPRQYSNRQYENPYVNYSLNPEMSGANNDMSYSDGNPYPSGTNPHRVSSQISSRWAPSVDSNPFADNESPVSPIIDLNAPSRTVSCYSRASHQGGLNILAHYDGSARDSQCASTYFYPGQLTGDDTDHLPPVPPVPDGISRTGSMLRGRSQNFSSPLAQFGGEQSDSWDVQQPLPAALRSGPRWSPPRGGLF